MAQTAYELESLPKRIRRRQGHYESRRAQVDAQRDAIVEVCRPDLVAGPIGSKAEGAFDAAAIVESTAPHALRVWQRGFGANMISRRPGQEWFREVVRDPPRSVGVSFQGNDDVNQYCQDFADVLRADMRRSNLYDVMGNFLLDGGSVGSPVMVFQEDLANRRLICRVPDYAAVWLDKDVFGYDNCLHLLWEWTALQAAQFFGKDQLPERVRQHLRDGDYYTRTKYLQVIYGAADPIYDDLAEKDGLSKKHPWLEHFIAYDIEDPQGDRLLKPQNQGPGYFSRPFATWHYHRNEHEVYSRTMAWWAIWDIRGLNGMWEALFGEAELSVRPATWAMAALQGLLDLGPGGGNWARSTSEYDQPPQYIERKTRYDVATDFIDRLTQAVQRHFHYPFFMAVNQIMAAKNQPETAYGLSRIQAENGIQIVEQIESYEQQVLGTIHDIFVDAAMRAGQLPNPPGILQEYSQDGEVDVEFIGPLSMMQINDRIVDRFYRVMEPSQLAFAANPETVHKFRWPEIVERLAEAQNFNQKDIVSAEEYQAIIDGARQRAIQQEIAEAAPKLTQAVKNLRQPIEKDSPLAALTGGKK